MRRKPGVSNSDTGREWCGRAPAMAGLQIACIRRGAELLRLRRQDAAQGIVFSQDGKTFPVLFDVERAIAVCAIRDGKLVDTGERIKLAAGPVSIRPIPR